MVDLVLRRSALFLSKQRLQPDRLRLGIAAFFKRVFYGRPKGTVGLPEDPVRNCLCFLQAEVANGKGLWE